MKTEAPVVQPDLITRQRVAQAIHTAREIEQRHDPYPFKRDAPQYILELLGLGNFLEYAKSINSYVLDIGAGTTQAMGDFVKCDILDQSTAYATYLRGHRHLSTNPLDASKCFRTPVETLRGVPDNQFGGIISVFGMGYSVAPEMAIASIDRVMKPGGALKTTFAGSKYHQGRLNLQKPDKFVDELQIRSYGVYVHRGVYVDILTAIKDGSTEQAESLFLADYATYCKQYSRMLQSV